MPDDTKLSSYLFTVEIDGIETSRFQKCEGIEAQSEAFEYEEGGGEVHHFQGRTRFPNLVLEKGINDNDELFKWFQSITKNGKPERKNGSVVLKDTEGREIKRWNFFRAFPCRWIGPALNCRDRSTFAVERIEIAHEGLEADNDSAESFIPPLELKAAKGKLVAQAGISDAPVYYDNYGNPGSDPYVVTGRNLGEPADIPASKKIADAAENHLGENYKNKNSCDEWAAKVLTEAGFSPGDYHLENTGKTVRQHIDELKAAGQYCSKTSNSSAYVVFMGDGTKPYTIGHEHAGLLVTDSFGKASFYHSTTFYDEKVSIIETYNSVSDFQNDFAYSTFYYQEIY